MLFPFDNQIDAKQCLRTALRIGQWGREYLSLQVIPPAVSTLLVNPDLPRILFGIEPEHTSLGSRGSMLHGMGADLSILIQMDSGGRLLYGAELVYCPITNYYWYILCVPGECTHASRSRPAGTDAFRR